MIFIRRSIILLFLLFFLYSSGLLANTSSKSETVYLSPVILQDADGGISKGPYEVELKLVSRVPLVLAFVEAKLINEKITEANAIVFSDPTSLLVPSLKIPKRSDDNTYDDYHTTLVHKKDDDRILYESSNTTLNVDTTKHVDESYYGTYDLKTQVLKLPLVSSEGEKSLYSALLKFNETDKTFTLDRLEELELTKADVAQHEYTSFDPNSGMLYISGVFVKDETKNYRLALSLLPSSAPTDSIQFKLSGLVELPDPIQPDIEQVSASALMLSLPIKSVREKEENTSLIYRLYLSDKPNFTPNPENFYSEFNYKNSQLRIDGLIPDKTYYVLVIAVDDEGKQSIARDYIPIRLSIPLFNSSPKPDGKISFGRLPVGMGNKLSFKIENQGSGVLILDSGRLITADSSTGIFELLNDFPLSIPPQAEAILTLQCTPKLGSHKASLSLRTNDPNYPEVSYSVTCQGVKGSPIDNPLTISDSDKPHDELSDKPLPKGLTSKIPPGLAKKITHEEATLEIGADALSQEATLGIDIISDDLPPLPSWLINVTKGPRKGYRMGPHGQRFNKPIKVRIPYDKGKLPPGLSEEDINTYYFDETKQEWVVLERFEVAKATSEVVSLTDHFTDFINAAKTCNLDSFFYLCYAKREKYSSTTTSIETSDDNFHFPVAGGAIITHELALYNFNKPEGVFNHHLALKPPNDLGIEILDAPLFSVGYEAFTKAIIVYRAPMVEGKHHIALDIINEAGEVLPSANQGLFSQIDVTHLADPEPSTPDPEEPTEPTNPPEEEPEQPTEPENPVEEPEQPEQPPEEPVTPPPPPPDPCEDVPPPSIPYIDMWQSGFQGLAVPIANATSQVGGLFAEHVFNSEPQTDMDDLGNDLFGRSETTGTSGDNTYSVTATDACGSTTREIEVPATDSAQNGESCLKSVNSCGGYTGSEADPINSSNGNFVHSYTDAVIASIGDYPLHLRRSYNSDAGRWATASIVRYHEDGTEEIIAGPPRYFGKGWSSNIGAYVLTVEKAPYYEGAQVLYPDGQTILFKKQGDAYENDAPANFDKLSRNGDGYLLERKANLQKWYFNSEGNLSQIVDRNGNATTFSYDDKLLKRIENPNGRGLDFTHNADGQIIQIQMPEGITLQYEYTDGLLTAYTNGRGKRSEYQYNSENQLTVVTTPKGHAELRMQYNSDGQTIEQVVGETEKYRFAYNDNTTVIADAYDNATQHIYDDKGRLVKVLHPDSTADEYGYNDDYMRTYVKDRAGKEWQHTFDTQGNLLSKSGPLGWQKQWQYNAQNRVTQIREKVLGNTFREFTLDYDSNANLTRLCMPLGLCAEISYDSQGLPLQLKDLNGNVTVNAYDSEGDLISVTNAEQAVERFEHDGLGRVVRMTKPMGNAYSYTHDANSNLLAVDGPLNYHLDYQYDANDNLIVKTDPNNGTIKVSYNASDKPVLIQNQLGFDVAKLSYGLMGEVLSREDAEGRAHRYDYNELLRVVRIAAPENTDFRFVYNPVGKIVDAIDANDTVKHVQYDDLYRPIAVIRNYRPAASANSDTNVTTRYSYDLLGNVLNMTDPEGYVFQYEYDLQSRKVRKQDAEEYEWHYDYDAMGNILSVLDPNQHRTSVAYTPTYRVQSITNPESHLVQFAYNPNGKLTDKTDAKNIVTHLEYNELDRLVRKTRNYQPDLPADHETNVTTKYQHDLKGNLRFITNPRGYTAEVRYDAAHRRVQVLDFEQGLTQFFYDKVDNLIQVVDAENNPTDFSFDDLDRLIAVTNAEDETKRYHYDPMGNRTHLIEADGTVTLYEFDGVYRLNGVTQNHQAGVAAANDVNVLTQYAYDARGLLTLMTNANGANTSFAYDGVGNMVKETDPLQSIWQYVYDGVGNKTQRIDAKGAATTYAYYPDDLLKEIRYADNNAVVYAYDANNNRTHMSDWLGNTAWSYDPLNRLTAQDDLFNRVLSLSYDAAGNRTGMVYPDGNQVAYAHSPNNWLSEVLLPEDQHTTYSRNKVGNVTHIANSNSTVTDVVYDKVYRTLSRSNVQIGGASKTNSAFAYEYNLVGHVTQVKKTYGWQQPNEQTESYTYDGLRRLATATIDPLKLNSDAVEMAYAYDPVGNRLSWLSNDNLATKEPFDGFVKTYEHNAANQMLQMTVDSEKPNGDYTALFSFDKNGNRVNKLETKVNGPLYGTDYSYDHENRLTLVQDYQLVGLDDENRIDRAYIASEYDGGGRRMSKRYDPKQGGNDPTKHKRIEYVWDGLDPIAEYNMLNGQHTDFYRGAQDRLMVMHQYKAGTLGTMYWYHHNFKGDVVGLSKQRGQSEHNYRYDPYGGVIADTGNFTEPHNHYTLTGKQFDEMQGKEFEEVTGLVYFGSRYYEPTTGVWMTQDSYRGTLDNPASLHRFGYVEGNPVTFWDWYGFVVYLGARDLDTVSTLGLGNHHSFYIIPDNPEDFGEETLSQFTNLNVEIVDLVDSKGTPHKGFTLAAFKTDEKLQVGVNQEADLTAYNEQSDLPPWYQTDFDIELKEITPVNSMSDTEFILSILQKADNYVANGGNYIDYSANKMNCTTFTNSTLAAIGVPEDVRKELTNFWGLDVANEKVIDQSFFSDPPPPPPIFQRIINFAEKVPFYIQMRIMFPTLN